MEEQEKRQAALKRLKDKRDFFAHLTAYVIINIMLVVIWALSTGGYFWPIWTIVPWGVGLAFHAWSVWGQKPITEADIEREMRSMDADDSYPAPGSED